VTGALAKSEVREFFDLCVPKGLQPHFTKVAKTHFPELLMEIEILKSALDAPPESTDFKFNCHEYVKKSKYLIRHVGIVLHKKCWDLKKIPERD
jgi:hypothetical protein